MSMSIVKREENEGNAEMEVCRGSLCGNSSIRLILVAGGLLVSGRAGAPLFSNAL
jgi:hypothetical protein